MPPPPSRPGHQQIGIPQRRAGAWLASQGFKCLEQVLRDIQPVLDHGLLEDGQDLLIKRAPDSHVLPIINRT